MALTRNRALALLQQAMVFVARQRPRDLFKRVRADLGRRESGDGLTPRAAWDIYKHRAADQSICSCGWLVEYGIYSFRGREEFSISFVRQFNALEAWNNEYIQLSIVLHHTPTKELVALGRQNLWSFEYPTLTAFFSEIEARQDMQIILSQSSDGWDFELSCEET